MASPHSSVSHTATTSDAAARSTNNPTNDAAAPSNDTDLLNDTTGHNTDDDNTNVATPTRRGMLAWKLGPPALLIITMVIICTMIGENTTITVSSYLQALIVAALGLAIVCAVWVARNHHGTVSDHHRLWATGVLVSIMAMMGGACWAMVQATLVMTVATWVLYCLWLATIGAIWLDETVFTGPVERFLSRTQRNAPEVTNMTRRAAGAVGASLSECEDEYLTARLLQKSSSPPPEYIV